jgi:hypothetical protein
MNRAWSVDVSQSLGMWLDDTMLPLIVKWSMVSQGR